MSRNREPLPAVMWDHCHTHGWIRGPVCHNCNSRMGNIDNGALKGDIYLEHRARCPECTSDRPPLSQDRKDARARVELRDRLIKEKWWEPCTNCCIVIAIHGIPISRHHINNVRRGARGRRLGKWNTAPFVPRSQRTDEGITWGVINLP